MPDGEATRRRKPRRIMAWPDAGAVKRELVVNTNGSGADSAPANYGERIGLQLYYYTILNANYCRILINGLLLATNAEWWRKLALIYVI